MRDDRRCFAANAPQSWRDCQLEVTDDSERVPLASLSSLVSRSCAGLSPRRYGRRRPSRAWPRRPSSLCLCRSNSTKGRRTTFLPTVRCGSRSMSCPRKAMSWTCCGDRRTTNDRRNWWSTASLCHSGPGDTAAFVGCVWSCRTWPEPTVTRSFSVPARARLASSARCGWSRKNRRSMPASMSLPGSTSSLSNCP